MIAPGILRFGDMCNLADYNRPFVHGLYLNSLQEYQAALLATENGGKPMIVAWCPPHSDIGPFFEAKVSAFPGLVLRKIGVDANVGANLA